MEKDQIPMLLKNKEKRLVGEVEIATVPFLHFWTATSVIHTCLITPGSFFFGFSIVQIITSLSEQCKRARGSLGRPPLGWPGLVPPPIFFPPSENLL
ncbi:hypothetical protein XELAEV_18037308mg [Xenopus laevis]|uniref:Uncharacterized protein n=1 Tax=Xenopus laevis TaxID=8355 RepID=A0A974CBW3_XENLA|nr:hypothetical protein XELAEV_18037308mg [Xenopus laevis]